MPRSTTVRLTGRPQNRHAELAAMREGSVVGSTVTVEAYEDVNGVEESHTAKGSTRSLSPASPEQGIDTDRTRGVGAPT
jgi:hypothetical protein